MSLKSKPIHELRAIAQGYGVPDIFQLQHYQLVQAIESKQTAMVPTVEVNIPPPVYDARLMTKPPSKNSSQAELVDLLAEHIARGLHIDFPDDETWRMRWGKREDNGTMRMPLRIVLQCANRVMK